MHIYLYIPQVVLSNTPDSPKEVPPPPRFPFFPIMLSVAGSFNPRKETDRCGSLSRSPSFFLFFPLSLALSLSLSVCIAPSLSLAFSLAHTHSVSLSLFVSVSLLFYISLSLSLAVFLFLSLLSLDPPHSCLEGLGRVILALGT